MIALRTNAGSMPASLATCSNSLPVRPSPRGTETTPSCCISAARLRISVVDSSSYRFESFIPNCLRSTEQPCDADRDSSAAKREEKSAIQSRAAAREPPRHPADETRKQGHRNDGSCPEGRNVRDGAGPRGERERRQDPEKMCTSSQAVQHSDTKRGLRIDVYVGSSRTVGPWRLVIH